jgi:hypothetical protein
MSEKNEQGEKPPPDSTASGTDSERSSGAASKPRATGGSSSLSEEPIGASSAAEETSILQTRVRRLEEENDRLREQYVGARKARYERTALGLALVGLGFGLTSFVVPSAREILLTLAGIGLFAGVITRFLTPERFIPLDIGESIYTSIAENQRALIDQLDLSGARIYLTTDRGPRLFVPEVESYDQTVIGDTERLIGPLIVGDTASRSGLLLRPAAAGLLRSFRDQYGLTLPSAPSKAATVLGESVVGTFELAAGVEAAVDAEAARASFEIREPLYGSPTRLDHPIGSFLGAGLAHTLETPIRVEVTTTGVDSTETMLVTCRWEPEQADTDGAESDPD